MGDRELRLQEIAEIAKNQRVGAYTPQSDAMTALSLIEKLALLLAGQRSDWRIGLSVKVKHRTHELYYEPPHEIIDVFPSGYGGIVDNDGVLKLKSAEGTVFLAAADEWQTA